MIDDPRFWDDLAAALADSDAFRVKARHLENVVVRCEVDGRPSWIELHRGRMAPLPTPPLRGAALTIAGPAAEWRRLLAGEIPYIRAINHLHGRLAMTGDQLAGAWSLPALSELFRVAAARKGAERDD